MARVRLPKDPDPHLWAVALKAALLIQHGGPKRQRFDTIARVLATPNHPKLQEPCEIYLYETELSPFKKYGISKDAVKRGATAGKTNKPRYKKLLWKTPCETRAEAISIEESLLDAFYAETVRRVVEADKKGVLKIIQEVTDLEVEEFQKEVLSRQKNYHKLGTEKFLYRHAKGDYDRYMKQVVGLYAGKYCVIDYWARNKFRYPNLPPERWEDSRGMEIYACPAKEQGFLRLEEVPAAFKRIYGFDLVEDP